MNLKIVLPQATGPTTCLIAPDDTLFITHDALAENRRIKIAYQLVADHNITTPTLTITITDN